ncbi:MAG: SAM-dependent methyltransferase, partial [Anaerolineales bacterium]|nr:SAM-dependent methyltransferase [Anaerolineales bacterium]
IKLTPIGQVNCGGDGFSIQIKPEYRKALLGLDSFSHINVLWWGSLLDTEAGRSILEAETPYVGSPEKLGIFATRSPARPNPICVSTISTIEVDIEQGLISTPWIDAENGTPVLDIKPYHPSEDRVNDFRLPDWCANWPRSLEESGDFDWEAVFINAQ